MNIDKAKILLDKINVLMKSMSVAPNQISEIEKDLMKSYVQQLYATFLEEATEATRVAPSKPKPAPTPKPKKTEQAKAAPVAPPPPPAPAPPPVVETVPEAKDVEMEIVPPPPPAPKPKPTPTFTLNEDMEEIFETHEATDIAEKLSQAPIKDLTKAFSINEKLFTVKELFGGDSDLFAETLRELNSLGSYADAKKHLASTIATKFNWTQKSKKRKAKEFVKTIKRRYA